MCDDHAETADAPEPDGWALTRRRLLQGTAALTGGLLLGGRDLLHPASALASPATAPDLANEQGLFAFRQAMHVHSSFSEGPASLQAQLQEAYVNGFHTLWTTDHDWRMSAYRAPETFHFSALTETVGGAPYTWRPQVVGELASRKGAIAAASPLDVGTRKGGLSVSATSAGAEQAVHRYELDGSRANQRHKTNVIGLRLQLEVLPVLGDSGDAWGQVELLLSYRPPVQDRPGGTYRLVYRLGPAPASRRTNGLVGVVQVPVNDGQWNSLVLDPVEDIAALWPDVVAGDNHVGAVRLGTGSRNRVPGTVRYSYLRMLRSASDGDQPLTNQAEIIAAYAGKYGELTVQQAVEVSGTSEHSNWFGGDQHLIDYSEPTGGDLLAWSTDRIHASGGLASLNHPFGSGSGGALNQSAQDAKRRKVTAHLLARRAGGVDIVEAGYRRRGGVSLETHLALVDTLWRAGYWVTATGVNDNHSGVVGNWASELNHFYTSIWQGSNSGEQSVAALRRGSAFVGELGTFRGFLDLTAEGSPMGSAQVRPGRSSWQLTVLGVDLPTGSTVEVLRGPVDYGRAVDPGTSVTTRLSASAFAGGSADVSVTASGSCFVRVQVRTADGRLVAFSNPVFLLQEDPPQEFALPAARRSPGAVPQPELPTPGVPSPPPQG